MVSATNKLGFLQLVIRDLHLRGVKYRPAFRIRPRLKRLLAPSKISNGSASVST